MKVRRPLKYALVAAGLAAGWAAGGALDGRSEVEKVTPPPPGRREPETRPTTRPARVGSAVRTVHLAV